jgi:hypothetical protein
MKSLLHRSAGASLALTAAFLTACATPASRDPRLYGDLAPPASAQRTIVIHPDTRHVNVEGGEIVRFVAGDKEFAWNFFVAAAINSFYLNEVAPPGILDHPVRAYVTPDPKYRGNGERDR